MISEIAWAGTIASAHDEWIELHNPGDQQINLEGWLLTDGDDIAVHLHGTIAAFSFLLLERSDDNTVANIPADQIYAGNLNNSGERLELLDPSGFLIDSANHNGDNWPAGEAGSRLSMERLGGDDRPGNWSTFPGYGGNGVDDDGHPIGGTPRQPNAIWFPPEPSPSITASPSPTPANPGGTPAPVRSILINELAWSGTTASASDEWIELRNSTALSVDLAGWKLTDGNDINVTLNGSIAPNGFYLLERTDDTSINDVAADQIYSGSLRNGGEHLRLLDPGGALIDSANQSNGSWPAGNADSHASMERRGGQDTPGNWGTFTGYFGIGHDASGNAIQGTPRGTNSLHFPTPQPTWIPGKVVINELLIRPHYDWQGTGGVSPDDEFIELINLGPFPVNLNGWALDDIPGAGSAPFKLPGRTIQPGELTAFFRSKSHISLNDSGDTVRLLDPSGKVIDSISYLRIRAANLSYGRFPDGSNNLVYGLWPTPRGSNLLFVEVLEAVQTRTRRVCSGQSLAGLRTPRLMRPGIHQVFVRAPAQIHCPVSATIAAIDTMPNHRFH
ncbi:MAG: lamin tail domain-containing protein [Anaerolineales bacterium]